VQNLQTSIKVSVGLFTTEIYVNWVRKEELESGAMDCYYPFKWYGAPISENILSLRILSTCLKHSIQKGASSLLTTAGSWHAKHFI
jgi:hypothetical protein